MQEIIKVLSNLIEPADSPLLLHPGWSYFLPEPEFEYMIKIDCTNVKLYKYLIKRTALLPGLPCLVDLTQRLQLTGAVGPIRDIFSSLWVDLPGMYNITQIQ